METSVQWMETELPLKLERLAPEDRDIILAGCLINYYAKA